MSHVIWCGKEKHLSLMCFSIQTAGLLLVFFLTCQCISCNNQKGKVYKDHKQLLTGWLYNKSRYRTAIGVVDAMLSVWHIHNQTHDLVLYYCPACRTSLIATRFWVVMICPIIKCLTVLEFSFILFDLCLFITIFNFILNYVHIVTFWIFTYHKIWILLIIFCFIWSYWIIYFLTCLECCELTGVSLLWPWLIKWK